MRRLSLLLAIIFLFLATFSACGKVPSVGSSGTSEEATTEKSTVKPVESAPLLTELSEELREQIAETWKKKFGEEFVCRTEWGNEDVTIFYYGTYQGLPVFFRSPVIDAMVIGYLCIGGVELTWRHPFQIYAYKDGELHMVAAMYAQKLLTDNDVRQIAAVHTYFNEAKQKK